MASSSRPTYILTLAELQTLTNRSAAYLKKSLGREKLVELGSGRLGVPPACAKAFLQDMGVAYDFKVMAHMNLKGGIGKTTATINLATRAVQYGFRTCVLDMDSQASASLAFDSLPEEDEPIFYDVWQKPRDMVMPSLKPVSDGLWILPSSLENGLLDSSLANPRGQKRAVKEVCAVLRENGFDLVLIDCPPALGTAAISSICAADTIVIPVGSDPFSFKGLDLTLAEIEAICETFQIPLPRTHVLFSRHDRREKMAEEAIRRLGSEYAAYYLPIHIRVSTEISHSLARKQTLFAGTRNSPVRGDYDRYTRLLLGFPF